MNVSVCLATYRGERFVVRQIESILIELRADDEIIVVDDCSPDGTVAAIERIGDPRISIHKNEENRREVFTFGRAISLARHDIIFLSDQDDVWLPGRVKLMREALLESGAMLVTSNFVWMDTNECQIELRYDGVSSGSSNRHLRNIFDIFMGKTNYYGCAMAFRRSLVPLLLPIPTYVESHDLWIALAANMARSNLHIDAQTFRKRQHDSNATSTVSTRLLRKKVYSRWIFLKSLWTLGRRGILAVSGEAD